MNINTGQWTDYNTPTPCTERLDMNFKATRVGMLLVKGEEIHTTVMEIKNQLRKSKNNKAPGPDVIKPDRPIQNLDK